MRHFGSSVCRPRCLLSCAQASTLYPHASDLPSHADTQAALTVTRDIQRSTRTSRMASAADKPATNIPVMRLDLFTAETASTLSRSYWP